MIKALLYFASWKAVNDYKALLLFHPKSSLHI